VTLPTADGHSLAQNFHTCGNCEQVFASTLGCRPFRAGRSSISPDNPKGKELSDHAKIQNRLKTVIQEAILNAGRIDGTDNVSLTNTDVVEALLEITGLYASLNGFETYSPTELAFKHALTLNHHINRFRALRTAGKLPFRVVPRSGVN
jgi:hypothetical protein